MMRLTSLFGRFFDFWTKGYKEGVQKNRKSVLETLEMQESQQRSNGSGNLDFERTFKWLQKSAAEHVYLKGNVYYYRFIFPEKLRGHFGRCEFKCSLRTGYLRAAKSIAATIHGEICRALRSRILPSFDELREKIQGLNEKFHSLVDANSENVSRLTQEDIRLRMNGYPRAVLDSDSRDVNMRYGILEHSDGKIN
jgi:hypothetical protein